MTCKATTGNNELIAGFLSKWSAAFPGETLKCLLPQLAVFLSDAFDVHIGLCDFSMNIDDLLSNLLPADDVHNFYVSLNDLCNLILLNCFDQHGYSDECDCTVLLRFPNTAYDELDDDDSDFNSTATTIIDTNADLIDSDLQEHYDDCFDDLDYYCDDIEVGFSDSSY